MSENIYRPDAVDHPLTRDEIINAYISKLLSGENPAEPELAKNASRIEQINIYNAKLLAAGGGGGGSDLPEVTSDDNGDVLTVVDGAWGKAAPAASGLEFFVVKMDVTINMSGEFVSATCDKTFSEISTAFNAETPLMLIAKMGMAGYGSSVNFIGQMRKSSEGFYAIDEQYDFTANTVFVRKYLVNTSGEASYAYNTYDLTPHT